MKRNPRPCRHCSPGVERALPLVPLPQFPRFPPKLPVLPYVLHLMMLISCHSFPKPKNTISPLSHSDCRILDSMTSLNLTSAHSLYPGWPRVPDTPRRLKPSASVSQIGAYNAEMSFRSSGLSYGAPRMQRRSRIGVVRAGTSVLTASRVEEGSGCVRVMGPGKADVNGIGRLLVLDEFFEFPNSTGLQLRDPSILLESVIYYCDGPSSSSELEELSEVEGFRPRHGVHLYLKSNMRSMNQEGSSGGEGMQRRGSCVVKTGGSVVLPVIDHVRDASLILPTTVDNVAVVRVIAGSFGNVSAEPPLHDFVMLDVQMRPGSELSLPLDPAFGIVIYILEGVGIFEPNRFEEDKAPFYQNEGHGLYIPPSQKQASTTIRTHEWSQLRFILVGAPAA